MAFELRVSLYLGQVELRDDCALRFQVVAVDLRFRQWYGLGHSDRFDLGFWELHEVVDLPLNGGLRRVFGFCLKLCNKLVLLLDMCQLLVDFFLVLVCRLLLLPPPCLF